MLNKMNVQSDGLYFSSKKKFKPLGTFKPETIKKALDFAYQMSFGQGGEHRSYRSGGSHIRKNGEIFANTFQGKLSEFGIYNMLHKKFNLEKPDLSTYGLGEWDDYDFILNSKKISIKSTKRFGQLLLLETKDWNQHAEYIPNIKNNTANYDVFILVRIEPYCEDVLKSLKALYSNSESKEKLENAILNLEWKYDIPGFIINDELKYAIENKHIIKQNELLNGKTPMDAENYYVQAGDMHEISELALFID